ncbi:MAG: RNA-protein complex protein Nop10 [Candidatus Lokiarchaeota archaeon]|nr:RNA-protein complex protein Nop10 [Candidatus Lokiarchaeota archaeon]
MPKLIRKCPNCGNYTLKGLCPQCHTQTKNPNPAKFSLQDNYGEYRRKLKKEIDQNE